MGRIFIIGDTHHSVENFENIKFTYSNLKKDDYVDVKVRDDLQICFKKVYEIE